MHTTAASGSASAATHDPMLTEDIDFTADLGEGHAHATPLAPDEASPPVAGDVPFHDEVPAAAHEQRFPVAPGRVLSDRFVLTKLIGTGGTCSVFLARDLEADRVRGRPSFVALKTPRLDHKNPAKAVERLQREFEHARRLSHSSIVQVFELGCDGDVWFMTMERLEGESLAAVMRRHGAALPAYLARRVLRGTADSLAYAHSAGIVHGDLNPANIFVVSGERVKLLDFGAACTKDQAPAAAATVAYASPQVLSGDTPQIRDDIFAFAGIAYQVLTGLHPFQQRSSIAARDEGVRPEAPAGLANEQTLALMAALSWEREARPEDARALAATLAPDAPRRRAVIEPEPPPSVYSAQDDTRWWLFGGVCVIAMIAAVVLTRMA